MIETHTYQGLWWTPSDPEEKLSGTLTITKGVPILDVVGDFGHDVISEGDHERTYSMSPAYQERLVGTTTDGRSVTLVDCAEVRWNRHFPGAATAIYRARAAIVGHIFEPDESVALHEIEIRTSELEQWVGHVPFPVEHFDATNDAALAKIGVTRPQIIEIPLANGERAHLRFEIRHPASASSRPTPTCTTRRGSVFASRGDGNSPTPLGPSISFATS